MEMPNTNHQVLPSQPQQVQQEKKPRPQLEQALKCPRCASTNTKFCYYNNYSLSQPRYFCKGCRRYWTQGGSLRNVPVGGGCRKNKRSNHSLNNSNSNLVSKKITNTLVDHDHHLMSNTNFPLLPSLIAPPTPLSFDPSDLTLAFAGLHKQSNTSSYLFGHANTHEAISGVGVPTNGFLDILRNGFMNHNNAGNNNTGFSFGVGGNLEVVSSSSVSGQDAMLSCETELAGSSSSCKELMDDQQQWQLVSDGNVVAVVDPVRDYWAGVSAAAGSSWQGIMNGSLM